MTNRSTLCVRFENDKEEVRFDWERGKGVSSPEPHNRDTRRVLAFVNSGEMHIRDWEGALREQQEESQPDAPLPTSNPTKRSISLSSEKVDEGDFRQAFDEHISIGSQNNRMG